MAKQRPSVIKRQREQVKRERQQLKAAKRLERKNHDPSLDLPTDESSSTEVGELDAGVSATSESAVDPA